MAVVLLAWTINGAPNAARRNLREIPQLNGDTAVFADTAEDPGHDQQPKKSR